MPAAPNFPAVALEREGLPTRIADILRARILDGSIISGERLVEAELAQAFTASRATIRSALQVLIAEGLVEIRPFKGAITRTLTPRDAEEIMAVRGVIEPLAARLAARHATAEKSAGLRQRLDKLLSLGGKAPRRDRVHADLDMHRYIVECSESQLLQQIYALLDNRVRLLLLNAGAYEFSAEDLSKQHSWLIQAICDGDEVAAQAAASHHAEEVYSIQRGRAAQRTRTSLSGAQHGVGRRVRERAPDQKNKE